MRTATKLRTVNLGRTVVSGLPRVFSALAVFVLAVFVWSGGPLNMLVPAAQASYITTINSQWTTVGSNIYYNSGNVGIGTTAPGAKLEVWHVNATTDPNTSNYPLKLYNNTWSGSQITGIEFWNGYAKSVPTSRIVSQMNGGGNGGENLYFQTQPSSGTNPNPNQPTTKLMITADGNVGIGTTAPGYKLDVNGTLGFGNWYNTINGNGTNLIYQTYNGYNHVFGGNNGTTFTPWMTIQSGGNVGIGSTTPSIKLSVSGGTGNVINTGGGFVSGLNSTPINTDQAVPLGYLQANYAPIGSGVGAAFVQGGNSFGGVATLGTNDNNLLNFKTNNTVNMTIAAGGNVGIGTTGPNGVLDVFQGTNSSRFSRSLTQYLQLNTDAGGNSYNSYGDKDFLFVNNASTGTGNLVFRTSNSNPIIFEPAGTVEKVRIDTNGNVGIGLTNPTIKLSVSGGTGNVINAAGGFVNGLNSTPVNTDQAVPLGYLQSNYAPIGSGAGSAFVQGGNSFGGAATLGTADNNLLNFKTNNAVNMTISAAGNVGIGTTNPAEKLEVAGALKLGTTADACDSTKTGTFRYDATSGQTYLCDGKRWINQKNCGLMTDDAGQTYGTVQIGGQCWMSENINIGTMLASGATMPNISDQVIEKWCYNNDPAQCAAQGGLYDWDEAMRGSNTAGARGICPSGWHIPSDAEYNNLEKTVLGIIASPNAQYVCDFNTVNTDWWWQRCADNANGDQGGTYGAGKSLKAIGQGSSVGAGDDLAGFKGLLSGYRGTDGSFYSLGWLLILWSSTPNGPSNAWVRYLVSTYSTVLRYNYARASGFSVRCLRD